MAQDLEAYDSIIIGSGQGGNPLSGALAGNESSSRSRH